MVQQFHFWVYIPKNWKQGLQQVSVHPCSWQHYSQSPKWKQPKCLSVSFQNEGNSDIYSHMDEF